MGSVNMNANRPQFNPAVNESLNVEANPAENPVAAPNGEIAPGPKISEEEASRLRGNYTATRGGDNHDAIGIGKKAFPLGQKIGFVLKNIFLNVITLGGYGFYQIDRFRKSSEGSGQAQLTDQTGLVQAAREQHADAISSFKFAHRTSINRFNRLCAEAVDKGGNLLDKLRNDCVSQGVCTQERFDRIVKDYRDTLVGYAQVAVLSRIRSNASDDTIVEGALSKALGDLLELGVGATEPQVEIPQEFKNSDSFKGFFSQFKNRLMCVLADNPGNVKSNQENEIALRAVIDLAKRRCANVPLERQEAVLAQLFDGFEDYVSDAQLSHVVVDLNSFAEAEADLKKFENELEGLKDSGVNGLKELKEEIARSGVGQAEHLFDENLTNLGSYARPLAPRFRFKLELLKLKSGGNSDMDKATMCKTALINSMRIYDSNVEMVSNDTLVDVGSWKGLKGKEGIYRNLFAKCVDLPDCEKLEDMGVNDFNSYLEKNKWLIRGEANGGALAALLNDLDVERAQQLDSDKVDIRRLLSSPAISASGEVPKYVADRNMYGSMSSLSSIINGLGAELTTSENVCKNVEQVFKTMKQPPTMEIDVELLSVRTSFMTVAASAFPKSFLDDKVVGAVDKLLVQIQRNYPEKYKNIIGKMRADGLKELCGETFDAEKILGRVTENIKAANAFAPKFEKVLGEFTSHQQWTGEDEMWNEPFDLKEINILSSDPLKSWNRKLENLEKKTKILNELKMAYEQHDSSARCAACFVLRTAPKAFVNNEDVKELQNRIRKLFEKSKDILETYKSKVSGDHTEAMFELMFNLGNTIWTRLMDVKSGEGFVRILMKQGEYDAQESNAAALDLMDSLLEENAELRNAVNDCKNFAEDVLKSKGYDEKLGPKVSQNNDGASQFVVQITNLILRYLGLNAQGVRVS